MILSPDQVTVGNNLVQYVYENIVGYSPANTVNIQCWRPDPKNSLHTSRTIHCNVHFTCIYIADNSIPGTVYIHRGQSNPMYSLYTLQTIQSHVQFIYIADNPIPRTVYVHCDNPIPRTVYIHRRQSNPMYSLCISQTF